ncbi:MAG: DUF1385 domain-containing protein [Candidatus Kaiserbacteria bacterium]|nr:DUF1385 domain-containing protein [Candidatus Kaiserbacteria bacterium]
MRILGGGALRKSVFFYTSEFTATARLKRDGIIESDVQPRNALQRFFAKLPYLPPKSIIFTLLLISGMKRRAKIRFALIFAGVAFVVIMLLEQYIASGNEKEKVEMIDRTLAASRPLIVIGALILYRTLVAGFHAAEHMAINAYRRFGREALDHVAEASRIDKHCMGRFIAPAITIGIALFLARPWLGRALPYVSFALAESVFWIDTLIGLERIRITRAASVFLQRYLTTRPPTKLELAVGREALRRLLEAHGEI